MSGEKVVTLAAKLEALRQGEGGCRLAAFGDLGASIVLRSSGSDSHRQEHLDELCQQARRGFVLLDSVLAAEEYPEPGLIENDILVLVPGEARVFVRAADGSGDAVLCVCDNAAVANRLIRPAQNLLASIAGEVE